jgi:hypothetical protein
MRLLQKGPRPPALATTCALPPDKGGNYDNLDKPPVSEALFRDQGGLCGFCMRRVALYEQDAKGKRLYDAEGRPRLRKGRDGIAWPWKIAHRCPQSTAPERALDWSNMIGACRGGDDGEGPRTCDTLQGNEALTVDPYARATVAQVRCRIGAAREVALYSDDAAIEGDLHRRLGLNRGYLPANRAEVLRAFKLEFARRVPKHTTVSAAEKARLRREVYDDWKWEDRAEGRLRPFCGVVEVRYDFAR